MVNIKEVERYLGYIEGADPKTYNLIESLSKEIESSIKGRCIHESFAINKVESNSIFLNNSSIVLEGKSIVNHLKGCDEVFILACTLGVAADRLIQSKFHLSALSGMVSDAIASDLIEQYCNQYEAKLRQTLPDGSDLTARFSPGYGDFPLKVQESIINKLQAHKRIGLSLNESFLMVPQKSVIAIIGISDKKLDNQTLHRCGNLSCEECDYNSSCRFKKI